MHNGSHVVDTVRMVFGGEPQVVSATGSGARRPGDPDLNVELLVAGATVAVEGFGEEYYQLFELEFRFQAGRVRFMDFGSSITLEQVAANNLGSWS